MERSLLLIVEDEPVSRELLAETLREQAYEVLSAATGAQAWEQILQFRQQIDVVLLDRLLPDMDALALLERLKADPALTSLPVIMLTSLASEADVAAGLKAGAYYYLTKPCPPVTLLAIVRSAVEDRRRYLAMQASLRQSRSIFRYLTHAEFWFVTREDARDLATQTAHIAPDPERVVLGLTELMLNAVEHGNLGITYAEKTALIAENRLEAEVERRLHLPEFAQRRAHLTIDRRQDRICYTIRDEGEGFDWRPYLDMSPARAFDTHGRGIAMSRLISFDELEYRDDGRIVVGHVLL